MIYRPLYVEKIMAYVDTPFVKILTGVRRCGKSTILKMIMERLETQHNIPKERIVSCRYDSMEYEDMTAKQIYTLLKDQLSSTGRTYLFLDEVQEIRGWEKVVNSLASDFDVDLYITGSNSRMMSSEIATYLTGRYISFRIFTLSFGEYLISLYNIREDRGIVYIPDNRVDFILRIRLQMRCRKSSQANIIGKFCFRLPNIGEYLMFKSKLSSQLSKISNSFLMLYLPARSRAFK